jgi:hypothetical protein
MDVASVFPVIGASFGCDVLFIAATRESLRWAGEMRQSYKIAVLLLLNCIFAAGFVLAPLIWALITSFGELLGGLGGSIGFGGSDYSGRIALSDMIPSCLFRHRSY